MPSSICQRSKLKNIINGVMKERVLLVMPTFMDLYKDVKHELERQGYDTVYMEDIEYNNRRNFHIYELSHWTLSNWYEARHQQFNENYWQRMFGDPSVNLFFDFVLVIDGFSSCDYLFSKLQEVNSRIKKILYLFDPIIKTERFDKNFKYYDSVFTFDIKDSIKYNISLLPIYWIPSHAKGEHYNIFGFASFGKGYTRYDLFKAVEKQSNRLGLKSFIKIYVELNEDSTLKHYLKKKFRRDLSLSVAQNIITHVPILPEDYRGLINSADIILDALGYNQTGMTTRFSWSIGAGKKIITDNSFVKLYPFYDSDLICIIDKEHEYEVPISFIENENKMKKNTRIEVDKFRIDNWVKTLLDK